MRLNVTVEGQTEETFVRSVLTPHLAGFSVVCSARRVATTRHRQPGKTGGLLEYSRPRGDIVRWLNEDRQAHARFTTMFDLYGLPRGFPGRDDADRLSDPYAKVALLEERMADDIGDPRFVPYIQLHEFEALVLVAPEGYEAMRALLPDSTDAVNALERDLSSVACSELIDEGRETAPSKRIVAAVPAYSKPLTGPLTTARIGVARLREACPHFGEWLARLEGLGR